MRMRRVHTQEDKESKMRKYMYMKAMGLSDNDCANKLHIAKSTIYEWKEEKWFEDLTERMPWEGNKELQIISINKLKRMLLNKDIKDEDALKAIDRVFTLNRGLDINKRPSGEDSNSNVGVFDTDILLRRRFGDEDVNG